MPKRQTKGAIGYDVRLRAIVSPFEMDKINPKFRMTLFDFRSIVDSSIKEYAERKVQEGKHRSEPTYRLDIGKMALCGIGFVTQMPFPVCYFTLCRSGMASKRNIIVANGPGTVDPDYRGEAGIILFNCGSKPFYLFRNMRIAQILFINALIPRFKMKASYESLTSTDRGCKGFGSTGTR